VHREGITVVQFVRSRYKKDFNQSTRVIFANPFFYILKCPINNVSKYGFTLIILSIVCVNVFFKVIYTKYTKESGNVIYFVIFNSNCKPF